MEKAKRWRRWCGALLTLWSGAVGLGSGRSAAAAPPTGLRTVGEVKCDADGDGEEDLLRLTLDDRDHSQVALVRGGKIVSSAPGPSSPSALEARQVVRDKACELAVTSDGIVKLALFKWRKEGALKKDHLVQVAELPTTSWTAEAKGDDDLLRVDAPAPGARSLVWVWSPERFAFDGPLREARCDVDGKPGDEAVRVRPGGERCEAEVWSAGRMVASARLRQGATCDDVEAQQAVGDPACEIVVPYHLAAARSAGERPTGYAVLKWSAPRGAVEPVADVLPAGAMTRIGFQDRKSERLLELRSGKRAKVIQTWRWTAKRGLFVLVKGAPPNLCEAARPSCATGETCDVSLVEQKKARRGLCVPRGGEPPAR